MLTRARVVDGADNAVMDGQAHDESSNPGWDSAVLPTNDDELRAFAAQFFGDAEVLAAALRGGPHPRDTPGFSGEPASLLDRLIDERPEQAWPLVTELIERAPTDDSLGYVGAGPLEDLVQQHGAVFADRIVERAQLDSRWRSALRQVWGWEEVSEAFRRRIHAVLEVPSGMELR